jgi:hypothetical protein
MTTTVNTNTNTNTSTNITITNNHTTLTIMQGANTRTINKTLIREVVLLKNNILKIDIGCGALRNIFLPIADITSPQFAGVKDLEAKLNAMLVPQDETILNDLTDLSVTINAMQTKLSGMMPATLQQPILIDDSNPYEIYSGYAIIGSNTSETKWAIMRTILENDVQRNQWVNNHQHANYVWDNRLDYIYA